MAASEKIRTLAWFARRPDHWAHACSLAIRKIRPDLDRPHLRSQAERWAKSKAASLESIAREIGYSNKIVPIQQFLGQERYEAAAARARACPVGMGGPGDLRLLHICCEVTEATRVIETGVAYGWSSFAILGNLAKREGAMLTSVDMPYPKVGNEEWVGIAVPPELRRHWRLIRRPDRNGLRKALKLQDGLLDVCHYDSDKSYYGRRWAYPLLWNALRRGGIFVSDDIQDNFAFKEFVQERGLRFFVTESQGKFVGICLKPLLE